MWINKTSWLNFDFIFLIIYAFGHDDVFGVADMPDNVSTAAPALVITASGASKARTVILLTPEEIDKATKMSISCLPLGQ